MSQDHSKTHLLPNHVRPINYNLQFEPSFDESFVKGTADIEVEFLEESDFLTLNSVELSLGSVILKYGETSQKPNRIIYDGDRQELRIEFEKQISRAVTATISLEFEAVLNDKGVGFYKSSYTDDAGNRRYMASTQMEPVDARRVFPCFDEPALKATFSIAIIAHQDLTCISNMNIHSVELQKGHKKLVRFEPTPPMSTYLVAMVIGDLEYIESTEFRIPIRVYTTPGRSAGGDIALKLATRTLRFYEEVFDVPFPLPKMDLVAVHNLFGAMENWGLVTFSSSTLLLDEKTSSVDDRKRVASVVQHELAHQWFGNLVTMDFWDGLWLNEGFATWMSWYSSDIFYPEWNVWQGFVGDELQKALSLDCLRSSHPVEVSVKDANEINQVFDAISYSKGACVIRMLAKSLGEETFLKGVQVYLKRHAFGNTVTSDLWDSMSMVSGRDVATEMAILTRTTGFPVLTVDEFEEEEKILIRQDRFLKHLYLIPEENQTIYPVPLGLITGTSDAIQHDFVLNSRQMEVWLKETPSFKLNSGHGGFFRTLYRPERLLKIGKAMNEGQVSVEDRIGIIADVAALSSSGHQRTSLLLGMIANLQGENNLFVWKQIRSCFASLEEVFRFEHGDITSGIITLKRDLIGPHATALGWEFHETDDLSMATHKAEMFQAAGEAGDRSVIEAALTMFSAFVDGDTTAIHPNVRNAVYAIALKYRGKEAFQALLSHFRLARSSEEIQAALFGLGSTQDPNCMQEILDLMLTDEIKPQDFYFPMMSLREGTMGAEALWNYTQTRWEDIEAKLQTSIGIFGVIVGIMIRRLVSKKHLLEVQRFFATKDTSKYGKQLALVLDSIEANVAWAERDREDVRRWLETAEFARIHVTTHTS